MARFNIEVELDWIDCEDGISIDEEIREQVIKGVKDQLLKRATDEAVKAVDKAIFEKVEQAKEVIDNRVDNFVEHICEESISKMQIPYKKNSWSDEVMYMTMSEYVGKRYEAFLNRKVFDKNGNEPSYESDKNTSPMNILSISIYRKSLLVR